MSFSVILAVEVWISWVVFCEFQGFSSPSPSPGCKSSSCAWSVILIRLFPHCWCFVDSGIEVSTSFIYCLVVLRFVQLLFCGDRHRTRCTLQAHGKVHRLSWVSFMSSVKLLVLESDPWSMLWSLFFHPLRGSGISVAWIFLWSSVMALCLSACSCTDLMTQLLFHGISRKLAWISSWDWPSCRLSVVVAESTSSELGLHMQWWRI
jgi:hypothetical protein